MCKQWEAEYETLDRTRERSGMDEIEAILAYQRGDAAAFRALFDLHAAHVYRTAYLIARDADRAEDVAQETFLILSQRLPGLASGPLRSWLDRVAANLSLNDRRRAWALPLDLLPASSRDRIERRDAAAAPDALLEAGERRAQLRAAVAALPPRQRAMVILRFYGDCSLAEIAVALGCRRGTVSATLHQALRRLRGAGLAGSGAPGHGQLEEDMPRLAHERRNPSYEE